MADYNVVHALTFQDANGQKATVRIHTTHADTVTLATLKTESDTVAAFYGGPGAGNGISNAKLVDRTFHVQVDRAELVGSGGPVDGQAYPHVRQQAVLNFGDAAGARGRISIPAPVDDNVMGEPPGDDLVNHTLDLPGSGISVSALCTWAQGHLTSRDGNVLNLYQGGSLKGGKVSRRRPRDWVVGI